MKYVTSPILYLLVLFFSWPHLLRLWSTFLIFHSFVFMYVSILFSSLYIIWDLIVSVFCLLCGLESPLFLVFVHSWDSTTSSPEIHFCCLYIIWLFGLSYSIRDFFFGNSLFYLMNPKYLYLFVPFIYRPSLNSRFVSGSCAVVSKCLFRVHLCFIFF